MTLDIRTQLPAAAADQAGPETGDPVFAKILLVLATVIAVATVSVATVFLGLT